MTTFVIKTCQPRIKNKKELQNRIFGKTKLNVIEVLTSDDLINSNISHDKFVPVNYLLREYNNYTKETIKNPDNRSECLIQQKFC